MSSLHRLISIVLVWCVLALVAVVSNPAFSMWFMPPLAILAFNVLYLAAALTVTALVLRTKPTEQ